MTETSPKPAAFDLDAILGELEDKPLTYKGQSFTLPAELPSRALAPFLRDDLGLVDLIAETLAEADDDAEWDDMLTALLKKAPKMPLQLLDAAKEAFVVLIGGQEQYDKFDGLNPSVQAWVLIARGIVTEYGVGLSDFFGSDESSDTDGDGSKPTSNTTTDSTPETSGETPETPGSSE